jgi:hypothetical protein
MHCNAMQCHAISCHAMTCTAMQCHALQCAMPCNVLIEISLHSCAPLLLSNSDHYHKHHQLYLTTQLATSNYYVITVFSDVAHVFPLCQPLLLVCCYASMNPPHQHIYIFPHTLTLPQCSYSHSQS